MDDSGSFWAALGQIGAMVEQGADKCAMMVAWSRVDDHPRRLVDRDQILILVEDRKGDRLGLYRKLLGEHEAHLDLISLFDLLPFFDSLPIAQDEPLGDQLLEIGAGEVRVGASQILVEPFPRRIDRDFFLDHYKIIFN